MSARYFSIRACSKPASARSCEARTKTAGASADGGPESTEVAACFRREEEHRLLGFVGYGDGDAFLADLSVPGLDPGEPVIGRWIGGAAEEDGD